MPESEPTPRRNSDAAADDSVSVDLVLQESYRFHATFDAASLPVLTTDEPPPLGGGAGPDPSRLLTAAVANCLAASLLFALRKFGNEAKALRCHATTTLSRNERKRLRVAGIAVDLHLGVAGSALSRPDRALAQFEDFCVVTQSIRSAFPVRVRVYDSEGLELGGAADRSETTTATEQAT